MQFTTVVLGLAALAPVLADLSIDREDVPPACAIICQPVFDLTHLCDVDSDRVGGDRNEDLLEAQCVCTNNSFDVGKITPLCASCIDQNKGKGGDDADDAMEDINAIMQTCGFSSTKYSPAQTTAAISASVHATRPVSSGQLTTTITGGSRPTGTGDQSSQTSSNAAGAALAPSWSVGAPLVTAYAAAMFFVGALAVY